LDAWRILLPGPGNRSSFFVKMGCLGSKFHFPLALLFVNSFQDFVPALDGRLRKLFAGAEFLDDLCALVLALEALQGLINGLAVFNIYYQHI
jgi:hypothetical protein